MSFGWSVGDIAATISLAYNIIEALDSCDGAAGDYREAVSFLRALKRTLEPLQAFTAWTAYPSYGVDIEEQVKQIREPVQTFLEAVVKYEPSLGAKAKEGASSTCVSKTTVACVRVQKGVSVNEEYRVAYAGD